MTNELRLLRPSPAAIAATVVLAAASLAPHDASAQLLAGQVVTAGTRAPLPDHVVRLVRQDSLGGVVLDSTRTDARGLFQLLAPGPGVYALHMGGGPWRELRGPVDTLTAEANVERMYELARADTVNGGQPYFEFQVDRPVVVARRSRSPLYPAELRARGVEGTVLLHWVVDESGKVEPGSVKVLKSDHALFTRAVLEALGGMAFVPAEKDGRTVRQVVQQPFQFALQR